MISRRLVLRGLIAAPAIVAVGSLMPIRGIIMPKIDIITPPENFIATRRSSAEMQVLIDGLKADGVWNKLDHLWIFKGSEEEEAMLDVMEER